MFGITDLGTPLAAYLGWIGLQSLRGALRTWRGEADAAAAAQPVISFSTLIFAGARRRLAGTVTASVGALFVGFGATLAAATL